MRDRLLPGINPASRPGPATLRVRILIESPQHEPRAWTLLAAELRRHWAVLRYSLLDLQPELFTNRFEIKSTMADGFKLDDADGLVLQWGRRDRRTLNSQIDRIEKHLAEPCPAFVAYLSPPQPASSQPLPALHWEVLRFNAVTTAMAELVLAPEDETRLHGFLQEALASALRRHALADQASAH